MHVLKVFSPHPPQGRIGKAVVGIYAIKSSFLWAFLPLLWLQLLPLDVMANSRKTYTLQSPAENHLTHLSYLRLPLNGIVTTMDPGLVTDMSSIELVEQLFLGLTDFDPKTMQPVPKLAASWEMQAEGMVYLFRLRTDVVWTDGKPVTAHNVVWALRRNILPQTGSPNAHMLFVLKNAKAIHSGKLTDPTKLGVRAIDDATVEFTLEYPATYFPSMVGFGIYSPLPSHTIERYGQEWTRPQNIQTNGPYRLTQWNNGEKIILMKNNKFFDADQVNIPEIRYFIVPESSVGLSMYEDNDLDILGGDYLLIPPEEILRITRHPTLSHEYWNGPKLCTYYYGFNTRLPPVDNPLVRKAISAAIDRRLLVDVVTQGDEEPATTFTRPPIFGSVDPAEKIGIQFNPQQAKKWLAEAGYPDGKAFPTLTLLYNTSETHAKIAQAIQTFLGFFLHIQVKLEEKNWTDFEASVKQPNTHHLFKYAWCADYPDANNWLYDVFHPTDSANLVGWNHPAFTQAVEQAQRLSDTKERIRLYRQAERILTEEAAVIIPLFFNTAHYLVKPWVQKWAHTAVGGQHIHDWALSNGAPIVTPPAR